MDLSPSTLDSSWLIFFSSSFSFSGASCRSEVVCQNLEKASELHVNIV
jgi:hypothetical protein